MTRHEINPASVFRSLDYGFSQAVAATGKRTIYISGQTAWDAERNLVGGSDLQVQARQAFRNLHAILAAAGAAPADVVFVRIHVVNYRPEHAAAISSAYREFFADAAAPAATWVGVAALADPGFLIEVEAVAVVD